MYYYEFGVVFLADSRWVLGEIGNETSVPRIQSSVGCFRAGDIDEVLDRYSDLRRREIGS